jgi:serine/threonine protein phosphatase 1
MTWNPFARPKPAAPAAPAAPVMPQGVIVFAIGDVHGRADLLELMLRHITREAGTVENRRVLLVCLGDYIDRGPRSRQVIDQLLALGTAPNLEVRYLRGNHERIFLDFLADPVRNGPSWCAYGGREALASYGVIAPEPDEDEAAWLAARDALRAALPGTHLSFFQDLETSFEIGDYFFAHAGAKPGVPLEDQVEEDLLWIREPFLSGKRRFEKVVVHGHSPEAEVHVDDRRIGLDTGAYATGVLSAIRLEDDDRRLIQTHRDESGRYSLRATSL